MTVQTRTARFEISAAADKGGWSVTVNPWGDVFFHRAAATVAVRYSQGGAVTLLHYNATGPVSFANGRHEIVRDRRHAAVEILQHDCQRFLPDGDYCGTCGKYSQS